MNIECTYTAEEKKKYCLCDTCRFVRKCFEDMDQVLEDIDQKKDITSQQVQKDV